MCECGKADCWCGELLSSGKGFKHQLTEEERVERQRYIEHHQQQARVNPVRESWVED